jgi:hypothetical protein
VKYPKDRSVEIPEEEREEMLKNAGRRWEEEKAVIMRHLGKRQI